MSEDVIAETAVERWEAHGLECAIRPGMAGLNGYVRLPENHPDRLFGEAARAAGEAGYDLLSDVEVHGGVTYGPDEYGWVGFDTAHAFDWWAVDDLVGVVGEEGMIVARFMQQQGQRHHGSDLLPSIRWNGERLKAEVEQFAVQLASRYHAEAASTVTLDPEEPSAK